MTPWDLLLLWILSKVFGTKSGPQWPEPKGPTGPTGPTGPGPTGPTGATGPGPTGPTGPGAMGGTVWKPYFYIQPDAGQKLGTPYALAGEWHGQGTAWTEMYNFTQGRPLGDAAGRVQVKDKATVFNWTLGPCTVPGKGGLPQTTVPIFLASSGEVWFAPDTKIVIDKYTPGYPPGHIQAVLDSISATMKEAKAGGAPYGNVMVGKVELTPNYAYKGDKLLIPFGWPETTNPTILARLETIPAGTSLPGVTAATKLQGDDGPTTI